MLAVEVPKLAQTSVTKLLYIRMKISCNRNSSVFFSLFSCFGPKKPQLNNILGVYGRLPQKRNQKVIRLGIQEEASQLPSRIPDAMRFKGYDHRFLQVSSKGTVRLVRYFSTVYFTSWSNF